MSRRKTRIVNVSMDVDLYARFREVFPMHGALSWFMREGMEYFLRELADDPPSALMRSMGKLKQDLTARRIAANMVLRAEQEAHALIHGEEE